MRMAIYSKVNGNTVITYRELTAEELASREEPTTEEEEVTIPDLVEAIAILTELVLREG